MSSVLTCQAILLTVSHLYYTKLTWWILCQPFTWSLGACFLQPVVSNFETTASVATSYSSLEVCSYSNTTLLLKVTGHAANYTWQLASHQETSAVEQYNKQMHSLFFWVHLLHHFLLLVSDWKCSMFVRKLEKAELVLPLLWPPVTTGARLTEMLFMDELWYQTHCNIWLVQWSCVISG